MAAYDLGYLSYPGVLDRLEPTFDTLLRCRAIAATSTTGTTLERWRR